MANLGVTPQFGARIKQMSSVLQIYENHLG